MIAAIEKGGRQLEEVMNYLYYEHRCREQVFQFVQVRKGTMEDAEDIFQDGIRNLILAVRTGNYQGSGSLTGYLFGICKNLWFKRFQKIQREGSMPEHWDQPTEEGEKPDILLMEKDQSALLESLLDTLDGKCRKVMEMWQLSYSMQEIASELGYKSEGVARKKKRLCLKKLLNLLENQPGWEQWLKT
ncbi:MAG: sigma-70 family RNA polymerase sigma factor [Bacteroidota bacterium]